MNFNLRMLNCWLGLCKGVDPLPKDFFTAGYCDRQIENGFRLLTNVECKPELIMASDRQCHSVLWEWKEGRTIDIAQLERYVAVTSEDLLERAWLTRNESQSHDSILLVHEAHVANTVELLEVKGLKFPVLGAFPGEFRLVRGELSGKVFGRLIGNFKCPWEQAPVSFVPIDRDSTNEEVAVHVVPLLIQMLMKRGSQISSEELCAEISPVFRQLGRDSKNEIKDKVTSVMEAAAHNEFSKYFEFKRQSNGDSTLKVVANPFPLGADRRSRVYKQMQRRQGDFVEALSRGHRPPPEPGLFDPM